jgi:hypothetical protein
VCTLPCVYASCASCDSIHQTLNVLPVCVLCVSCVYPVCFLCVSCVYLLYAIKPVQQTLDVLKFTMHCPSRKKCSAITAGQTAELTTAVLQGCGTAGLTIVLTIPPTPAAAAAAAAAALRRCKTAWSVVWVGRTGPAGRRVTSSSVTWSLQRASAWRRLAQQQQWTSSHCEAQQQQQQQLRDCGYSRSSSSSSSIAGRAPDDFTLHPSSTRSATAATAAVDCCVKPWWLEFCSCSCLWLRLSS